MRIRLKDVNGRGRKWIDGELSDEDFFDDEKARALEIAIRSVDARIALKMASQTTELRTV